MERAVKAGSQPVDELGEMRQRIAELEKADAERKRAEEALRESEKRLRALIEKAPDVIYVSDLEGNIIDVNKRVEELLGYSRGDIIGNNFVALGVLSEEHLSKAIKLMEQAIKFGASGLAELELIRKDGSRVSVEVRSIPVERGSKVEFIGIIRDITERKRAEEALRESEEKLRVVFECIADGVLVTDLEGNIVELNDAALRLVGYSNKEELIGRNSFEFVSPKDRAAAAEATMKTLEEGRVQERTEYTVLAADGRQVDTDSSVALLHDSSGNRTGIINVVRDITERKRAEEALTREKERAEAYLNIAGVMLAVVNADESISMINKKGCEILGYKEAELIGRSWFDLLVAQRIRGQIRDVFHKLMAGDIGPVEYYENPLLTKDGEERLIAFHNTLIRDAKGQIVGCLFSGEDITERKRAEEEIKRHTRRVEALHAVAQTVSQTLDLDEMLDSALGKVVEVMDADMGLVFLVDMAKKAALLKAHRELSKELIRQLEKVELEEEELEKVLQWKEPSTPLSQVLNESTVGMIGEIMGKVQARSFAVAPFWVKGQNQGVIAVGSYAEGEFCPDDIGLLRAIGSEIGVGIQNARLLEKTIELSITDELTGLYNRRRLYEVLDAEMYRTQRYGRSFCLAILDLDEFKQYNDKFGHSNGDAALKALAQTLKSQLRKSDTAFRHGGDEFAVIMPATDADRADRIVNRVRSKWLQAPKSEYLVLESSLGFSVGIAEFPEDAETADGLVFLADTALYRSKREGGHRSTLVSDLGALSPEVLDRATLDQVYALSATVEAKDPQTYGHSKRVAAISEMLGRAIGLSQEELANLYAASLLHDIGKVGVTDSILTKPGMPTEDEWRLIRKHPAEGARIVGLANELAALVPMIRYHHEWYDGSGYPDGLRGAHIPLGARIISIADAYDTMTTQRLYRDVVSQEEALEELRRCSGTQFDPELVEAFCRAMNEAIRQDQTY